MTSKMLTKENALLLQRYVDGEANEDECRSVDELLERSAPARVYRSALESLGEAVKIAEAQAWQQAVLGSADEWTALAEASSELTATELDELAPLLERFHDGEADETEAAVVAALVEERDDVAQYLCELDRLSSGIRQAGAVDDVEFDDFWDGIAQEIDDVDQVERAAPTAVEPYDAKQHRLVLYRYHDGEVSAQERRLVEAWLDANEEEVDATLGALAEVNLGVNSGIETARERADLDDIWAGVSKRLDALDAERAAENVVALDKAPESGSDKATGWNRPILAIVASIALLITGAMVGQQLLEQSADGVETTQKVVIFDSIESAPGSTVTLWSPQLAEHNVDYEAAYNGQYMAAEIDAADDEADPTVLWVIDEEDDDDDDDDDDDTVELPGPI